MAEADSTGAGDPTENRPTGTGSSVPERAARRGLTCLSASAHSHVRACPPSPSSQFSFLSSYGPARVLATGSCRTGLAALIPLLALIAVAETSGAATLSPGDTAAVYARIGSSTRPSFSPDGSRVAFLSDVSGSPQVWTVPTERGWPARATSLPDPVLSVQWSPAGDQLAVEVAPSGRANRQICLFRPDGSGERRLTPGREETNWLQCWGPRGELISFATARRAGGGLDAYVYDIVRRRFVQRLQDAIAGAVVAISPDGRAGLLHRARPGRESDLLRIDLASGRERLLASLDGPLFPWRAAFSADGGSALVIADDSEGHRGLASVQAPEFVAVRPAGELKEFAAAPGAGFAALLWTSDGRGEVEYLNLESGERTPGPDLPLPVAADITVASDGRHLAMTLAGHNAPPDIWVIKRETGEFTRLTNTPRGAADLDTFVRPQPVRCASHDGAEIRAWLYRSPAAPLPGALVLAFDGEPGSEARPGFQPLYQALLAAGISVFAPNIRGAGGRGRQFRDADDGPLRLNAIGDIRACAEFVIGAGYASQSRLGVMGSGYGGYLAAAAAAFHPGLWAAGVSINGWADLAAQIEGAPPWRREAYAAEYGDPAEQADMLRALSPIHHLPAEMPPMLVVHGANNGVTPAAEAERFVNALRDRGAVAQLVMVEGEGESIRRTANRTEVARAVVEYLADRLGK